MKKLIVFIVFLFFVSVFAEDYTKGFWSCEVTRICELSDYTGEYTKNCKDLEFPIIIYWEYARDKYDNLLFCSKPQGKEKLCTKIISRETYKNDYGKKDLIITGETTNYIFGESYDGYNFLSIIYHLGKVQSKNVRPMMFSHFLCVPLFSD